MGDLGDTVSATLILRGVEYNVTFTVLEDALEVEVEEVTTGEEWRGRFTSEYLEQMTHKTGNFKKFNVFVDMFRSVLTQPHQSLSVDLMTFQDLQELRRQNRGGGGGRSSGRGAETSRYLILVYTAPYDRIYYPLTLHYQGRADPAQLKATILELRAELGRSRGGREARQLRQETRRLRAENERLRQELSEARARPQPTGDGAEVRTLRAVVAGLEEDLAAERSRAQRLQQRLNRERNQLREEADEARAAERLLRVRVRTLVNELALYKRDRSRPPASPASSVRSVPAAPPYSPRSPRLLNSSRSADGRREARPPARPSSDGSMDRLRRARARSASPRFDPTAYVEDRRRRRQESEERHAREVRARLSGGSLGSRTGSPAGSRAGSASSSQGRRRPGYRAYLSSEDEDERGVDSDSSASMLTGSLGRKRSSGYRAPSSINSTPRSDDVAPANGRMSRTRTRAAPVATARPHRPARPQQPAGGVGGAYHLEEMRDIDERINRLNQFLTQVIQERA